MLPLRRLLLYSSRAVRRSQLCTSYRPKMFDLVRDFHVMHASFHNFQQVCVYPA
jgi:hypothetical protein